MLIFKIGEYEIKNKNLLTTLNQLSKIECEDEGVSISGTIISIENTPYILSRISLNVGNSLDMNLVDPCCGVGTVIIEALSMGIDVHGYDINKSIVSKARRNLEFFGYERQIIEYCDINNLEKKYDVAIIDLPYNLFTPIKREEQISIITSSYKICNRLILLTFEDMESDVLKAGFKIVDKCTIPKGKFIRRLLICEKERRNLNESYK